MARGRGTMWSLRRKVCQRTFFACGDGFVRNGISIITYRLICGNTTIDENEIPESG